jgi:hypothetical protein
MDTLRVTVRSDRAGVALPAHMLAPIVLSAPVGRRRPECGTPDNEQDAD